MIAVRIVGAFILLLGAVATDQARKKDDGWALASALLGIGLYLALDLG